MSLTTDINAEAALTDGAKGSPPVAAHDQNNVATTSEDPKKYSALTPAQAESREPDPVTIFGHRLPHILEKPVQNFQTFGQHLRIKTITAMPEAIVNNSSNVIGMTQLAAEVLMAKSGGVDLVPKETRGNPASWVIQPPKNILKAVFGRAKSGVTAKEFFEPEFLKNEIRNFNDLERATLIDSANHTKKLINRFSSRSGFAGIVAMTVAAVFPDEKDSPDAVYTAAEQSKSHPAHYVASRFGQALAFPFEATYRTLKKFTDPTHDQHIGEHKRQFSGLGMMMAGTLSFVSGFRQVEGKFELGPQHYMRNPWQMAGGVITAFAGSQLMLSIDSQQGWTNYGKIQFLRLLTLPESIRLRFKPGPHGKPEQGAEWYLAAQGGLQTKNVVASLIGGAEKHDGVIIDHKNVRKEAREHAKEVAYRGKNMMGDISDNEDKPGTKVSAVSNHAKALPERVTDHSEMAATV